MNNKTTFILLLLLFIAFVWGGNVVLSLKKDHKIVLSDNQRFKTIKDVSLFKINDDDWVEGLLSNMTIEEKVGQLIFPYAHGFNYGEESEEYQRLSYLVNNLNVGGFVFFRSRMEEKVELINRLQNISRVPLLISADFENGVTQRVRGATSFPNLMGVGAANDVNLTYKMAEIIAKEGRALGVHLNFAPVSDVNNNPLNPIINVRAFGEDIELVKKHTNAFIKGLQNNRMAATAKHFPGHGNTSLDSHRSLPVLSGIKSELNEIELSTFKSNISSGVMSVMIGHLAVPAFEPKKDLPSSLSEKVVSELLQNKMGFKGLVVTDAMNMKSITKNFSNAEAAVLAIKAGNDVILFPENEDDSYFGILDAVKTGDIDEERINHSVRKVLLLKKWVNLDSEKFTDVEKMKKSVGAFSSRQIAKRIAEKSITIVKNNNGIIPIRQCLKTQYVHYSLLDSETSNAATSFEQWLSDRLVNIKNITLPLKSKDKSYTEAVDSAKDAEVIILSVYVKVRDYKGSVTLTQNQEKFINTLMKLQKPVIMLSHGNPYLLMNFPDVDAYLCNYGDIHISEKALEEAIFGEKTISGILPVSIPNSGYSAGSSMILEKSALSVDASSLKQKQQSGLEKIDVLFEKAIKDSAFPGAVILIAKDGNIVYEKAYGKHTYDRNAEKMTASTIFDLASVTKVTATTNAAMICIDRGLFKLDDKVTAYIPAFAASGKENVRIRNLLLHNSGLQAFKPYYKMNKKGSEIIDDIYLSKLEFEPGTKTLYSDLGMITLQKIIEKVTGKTLDRFCYDELFAPLGMKNTLFNPPVEMKNRIAPTEIDDYWRNRLVQGEVHDENAFSLGGVAGHAGLFSTARDISVLLQMLLQKGFYQGKQYIKKETVELFTKRESESSTRCLGWGINSPGSSAGKLFSPVSYGHTGFTGTSVWTDPTRNLIVVLLTNRVYPTRENSKLGNFRPSLHSAIINALEK